MARASSGRGSSLTLGKMRALPVLATMMLASCAHDISPDLRPEVLARDLTADEVAIRQVLYSECVAGRTNDTFYLVEGDHFVHGLADRLQASNLRIYRDAVFAGPDRRVVDRRKRQSGYLISVSEVKITDGVASARIQIVQGAKHYELRAADLKKDGAKWTVTQWYRTFT
jgi:hypothetical protein